MPPDVLSVVLCSFDFDFDLGLVLVRALTLFGRADVVAHKFILDIVFGGAVRERHSLVLSHVVAVVVVRIAASTLAEIVLVKAHFASSVEAVVAAQS